MGQGERARKGRFDRGGVVRRRQPGRRSPALVCSWILVTVLGCGGDGPLAPQLYSVGASGVVQNLSLCCPLAVEVELDGDPSAWETVNAPQPRGVIFWSTTQARVRPGSHAIRLSVVNDSVTQATYRANVSVVVRDGRGTDVFTGSLGTQEAFLAIGEELVWTFEVP